jgi:superfamily I DNA and RNA helicase
MEKRIASPKIRQDHAARSLIKHLEDLEEILSIRDGIIYYDFPLFRDENNRLYRPNLILASRNYGLVLFAISNDVSEADVVLSQIDSVVYAKLLKSPFLRKGKREIIIPILSIIYTTQELDHKDNKIESDVASTFVNLKELLSTNKSALLADKQWKELISLIEGGKGITRPKERDLSGLSPTSKGTIIAKIEEEIVTFDKDQRLAAITMVDGPQRIRGLAGSGKTIVLAMKAAHIHLRNRNSYILFTFWTRSLYELVKELITRFYRQFDDRDPDWTKLHVLHAWGGKQLEGVYYNACVDNGRIPLTLKQVPISEINSFGYVCKHLIENADIKPKYDYVLIDEGQDFPTTFYRLCFHLTKGGNYDRNVIWAYDELQTILETDIQNVTETFGRDKKGASIMDLERAGKNLSAGLLPHDIVLHTCYRNPPEILVIAHALGFGIYSEEEMVQMLENKEHWEDLGYIVEKGNCVPGEPTVILRPKEHSPLSLTKYVKREEIIQWEVADDFADEIDWICMEIKQFIKEGLRPEDILVVSLDDRNARSYFKNIAKRLAENNIAINNVLDQAYVEPQFFIENHVTLSTVYRAKGNEAAVVFGIGLEAIYPLRNTRKGRNRLFTLITRSKAWLRISGIGIGASFFVKEMEVALKNFPYMKFKYPNRKDIELIQRDLSERSAKIMEMQQMILDLGLTDLSESEIKQMFKGVRKKKL